MDDIQLYQIFWSFLIVYMISLFSYCILLILSIYYDNQEVIKYTFRILMFTLIYQFIEIILRRYDLLLIFLRLILIVLFKKWITVNQIIIFSISVNPDYANITISQRRMMNFNQINQANQMG
jgi:hypothetical protein